MNRIPMLPTTAMLVLVCLLGLPSCSPAETAPQSAGLEEPQAQLPSAQPNPAKEESMNISSPAFDDHGEIPTKYTCDGNDTIPPLAFDGVPSGAKTLALVIDDPDVPKEVNPKGYWDHWVVWNLPADASGVDEGIEPGGVTGKNGWGKNQYGGPCPPDRRHRYFFKLYALDTSLDLPSSAGKKDLEQAMQGHVIEQAELVGTYDRPRKD